MATRKSKSASKAKKPSKGFVELLGQALIDENIREKLLNAPETLVKDFKLSSADLKALHKIDRATLEKAAGKLGGATTAEIKIVISGSFSINPPE